MLTQIQKNQNSQINQGYNKQKPKAIISLTLKNAVIEAHLVNNSIKVIIENLKILIINNLKRNLFRNKAKNNHKSKEKMNRNKQMNQQKNNSR